ncbi:hypothetical protein H0H87_000890 [Tephrocybe sp. NHM501043]|nr:hypothetical protein H0H87_000890 [Tephrocybe sp. NHM501043]
MGGNHETPGTWRQGALDEDLVDLKIVVEYLKSTYGYVVDVVVGHSRGSLVGMLIFIKFVSQTGKQSETQAAAVWKKHFDDRGYYEWTVSVARKSTTVKIFPDDLEAFVKWDTSFVWTKFPPNVDVLTLHGLSDSTVPPYDAIIYTQAFSSRSSGTHMLNLIENADHNFTGRQDEVVSAILDWWTARERGELKTGVWVEREALKGRL